MVVVMLQMDEMILKEVWSDQAEKMAKKADAWKEYKEAAMVDMMLQTLPKAIISIKNMQQTLPMEKNDDNGINQVSQMTRKL